MSKHTVTLPDHERPGQNILGVQFEGRSAVVDLGPNLKSFFGALGATFEDAPEDAPIDSAEPKPDTDAAADPAEVKAAAAVDTTPEAAPAPAEVKADAPVRKR